MGITNFDDLQPNVIDRIVSDPSLLPRTTFK